MKKSLLLILLLSITCRVFSSVINIDVSSLGDYSMYGKTFYIVPGSDDISQKDLEWKENIKFVASYIIFNGGIETTDTFNADVCIFLNYGIGESKPLIRTHSIRGNTGVSSVSVQRDLSGNVTGYNVNQSQGTVGVYQTATDQYRRYIDIYACDNHNLDEILWKANIESTGTTNDLRYLFPYMMYASKSFLGRDSKYKREMSINDYYINEGKNVLMKMVAAGDFRSDGMIALPKVSSMSPSARQGGLYIIAIQKDKNKTVVLFEYFGDEKIQFSEKLILDPGNGYRNLKPRNSSIDLTKKLKKNTRYFTIEFDALETDGPIDIIDLGSGIEYVTLKTDDELVDIIDSKNRGKYNEFEIEESEPVGTINPEKIIFWKGIQTKH